MENNDKDLSQQQKDLITFGEGMLKTVDTMVVHYVKEAVSRLVTAMVRLSIFSTIVLAIIFFIISWIMR